MTIKKKAAIFTAFLLILLTLALLVPPFLNSVNACRRHKHRPPPLGKCIIKHFVYPDGTPIGTCLDVTIWNTQPLETQHTDQTGTVIFANYPDGTYKLTWSWQGVPCQEYIEIRCNQIVWEFTNEVPYWTLEKTFVYPDGTPIVGLDVYFDGQSDITDASGTVTFTGLKACVDYTVSWSWQGVPDSEIVHITGFQTPSPVELTNNCAYWTVEKYFYYDTDPPLPISHLTVTMDGWSGITDENGLVVFNKVKAGTYTIAWVWGGQPQNETFTIGFQTPSPVVLTNYLKPKSGGGDPADPLDPPVGGHCVPLLG